MTVSFAVAKPPLGSLAVIVAVVAAPTAFPVMVNLAEVAPAATVTVCGTVAAAELLMRLTMNPPVGAAAFRVTVPEEVEPA